MIEWRGKEVLKAVDKAVKASARDAADYVARDARSRAPWDTGVLAQSITIEESKFKDGGWLVVAQGPKNYDRYYASFVELGCNKKRNLKKQPYLRPALYNNLDHIRRLFVDIV